MSGLLTFEGSYGGHARRIAADTRLECKICWHVYDPARGCESWQVAPGTPFSSLPADWRCPGCDAPPSGFMALDVTLPAAVAAVILPSLAAPEAGDDPGRSQPSARTVAEAFEQAFRELHRGRMRDVPFLNPALQVQAIGFRPFDDAAAGRGILGVMLTPWFMNIVLVPELPPDPAPPIGGKSALEFPSGRYEFVWNDRAETGPYRACSLFSPVMEFASQLQAVEVGVEVLKALFQEEHREEGARSGEIRARREQELRRQEELQPQEELDQNAAAAAAPAAPAEGAAPSRRALFVPRRRDGPPAEGAG